MKGKKSLDAFICVCACAVCATSYYYLLGQQQLFACIVSGIVAIIFLVLLLRPRSPAVKYTEPPPAVQPPGITEAVLINEDNEQIATWDLFGKIGIVIGRDVGENHVNINLSSCTYASMIEVEHALLNHAAGNWYVEDIGAKNGVSVMKAADGKKYHLAVGQPCLLQPGDIIYIAMTRLLVR